VIAAPTDELTVATRWGSRIAGGTAWVFGSRIASRGVTVLVNIAIARLLIPGSVGTLLLAITVATVGATIARVGMDQAPIRLVAQSFRQGDRGRAAASVRLSLLVTVAGTLVVGGVLLAGGWRWLALHAFHSVQMAGLETAGPLLLAALALQQTASSWFKAVQAVRLVSLFDELLGNILWWIPLVILWLAGANVSVREVMFLRVLSLVLLVAVMFVLVRYRLALLDVSSRGVIRMREALDLGATLMVTSLVGVFLGTSSDLLIIGALRPHANVAGYGFCTSVAAIVSLPFLASNVVAAPALAAIRDGRDREHVERSLRLVVAAVTLPALLFTAILAAAGGPILGLVFGGAYGHYGDVLAVLALGQFFLVATGPCGITLQMMGQHRVALVLAVVTAVVSIAGDLYAVTRWGVLGVAVATTIAYALNNIAAVWLAKRLTGVLTLPRVTRADLRLLRAWLRGAFAHAALDSGAR